MYENGLPEKEGSFKQIQQRLFGVKFQQIHQLFIRLSMKRIVQDLIQDVGFDGLSDAEFSKYRLQFRTLAN